MPRLKAGISSFCISIAVLSVPGPTAFAIQNVWNEGTLSGTRSHANSDSCKTVSNTSSQSYSLRVDATNSRNKQLVLEYETKGMEFLGGAPKKINAERAVGGQFFRSIGGSTKMVETLPNIAYVNLEFIHYPEFKTNYQICNIKLNYLDRKENIGGLYSDKQKMFANVDNELVNEFSINSLESLIDVPSISINDTVTNAGLPTEPANSLGNSFVKAYRVNSKLLIHGAAINNTNTNALALGGKKYHINTSLIETIVEDVNAISHIPVSILSGHDQLYNIDIPISKNVKNSWTPLFDTYKTSELSKKRDANENTYRLSAVDDIKAKHRRLLEAELPPLTSGMKLIYPEPWSGIELEFTENENERKNQILEVEMLFQGDALEGAEDAGIYRYDEDKSNWLLVASNSTSDTNLQTNAIKAIVDRSGKYIAATIEAPDSPEGVAYTPNYFSERNPASPTDNLSVINPPTANQNGDATLNYQFALPPGRNNIQPELGLTYSSSGSSGWLGLGWDLNLSSISIDTRWGYPLYHPVCESETYQLDGQQLWPSASRLSPAQIDEGNFLRRNQTTSTSALCKNLEPKGTNFTTVHPNYRLFKLRVDNQFLEARRYGDSPSTYFWVVKLPNGHTKYYGNVPELFSEGAGANHLLTGWYGEPKPLQDCTSHLESDPLVYKGSPVAIAEWPLVMEEDEVGNSVVYCHKIEISSAPTIKSVKARNLYLSKIFYTGLVKRSRAGTQITADAGDSSKDVSIAVAHRLGPYTVNLASDDKNSPSAAFSYCATSKNCFEQRYSANLGLARAESHLLTKVTVGFNDGGAATANNQPISEWDLQYRPGYASKPLLAKLVRNRPSTTTTQELDQTSTSAPWLSARTSGISSIPIAKPTDSNHEEHSFEYESAPSEFKNKKAGYCDSAKKENCVKYEEPPNLSSFADNISFNATPFGKVSGTALSATRSRDTHAHLYTGISWQYDKAFSAGVTTGYSKGRTAGALLYADLDGDSVGDWIARPGTAGNLNAILVQGGPKKPDTSSGLADSLRKSLIYGDQTNTNKSFGVQVFAAGIAAGFNQALGKAKTDRYTMDVNGDGWSDVVDNGVAHFAQPAWDGPPNSRKLKILFGTNSEQTPVPFHTNGKSSSAVQPPTPVPPEDELIKPTSLIAVWKSPIDAGPTKASFTPIAITTPTEECIVSAEDKADFQLSIQRLSETGGPAESAIEHFRLPDSGPQPNSYFSTCDMSSIAFGLDIPNANSGDLILYEIRRSKNNEDNLLIPIQPKIDSTPYSEPIPGSMQASHPGASAQSQANLVSGLSSVGNKWNFPQCDATSVCPTITELTTSGSISSEQRLSENIEIKLLINGLDDPGRSCTLQKNIASQMCQLDFNNLESAATQVSTIELAISSSSKYDNNKLLVSPVTLTYKSNMMVDGDNIETNPTLVLTPTVVLFDVAQSKQSPQFKLGGTPQDSIKLEGTYTFSDSNPTPGVVVASLNLKEAVATPTNVEWLSIDSISLYACKDLAPATTYHLDVLPSCTSSPSLIIPIPGQPSSPLVAELAITHPNVLVQSTHITPMTGPSTGDVIQPIVSMSNYNFRPTRIGNNWSVFSSKAEAVTALSFEEVHNLPAITVSQNELEDLATACNDASLVANCEQNPTADKIKEAAEKLARVSPLSTIGRGIENKACGLDVDFTLQSQDGSACFSPIGMFVGDPNPTSPTAPIPAPEFNTQPSFAGRTATPYLAISKLAETRQTGLSIAVVSAGESKHVGRTEYLDINGDRWPDPHIARGSSVGSVDGIEACQITLPFGGRISGNLGGLTTIPSALCLPGTRITSGVNASVGMSGNFPRGQGGRTANQGNEAQGSNDTSQTSSEKGSLGFAISGTGNVSVSRLQQDFSDVNGDGLVDVFKPSHGSINSTINFGAAGFKNIATLPVSPNILIGEDLGCGTAIGASFNKGVYDFAGGVNLNTNETQSQTMFVDYDGDGLVDILSSANTFNVTAVGDLLNISRAKKLVDSCLNIKPFQKLSLFRNLGDRFESTKIELPTGTDAQISLGSNKGRGAGLYVSIPIPIPFTPLSVIINPGVDLSESYGAQKFSIQDADGYGLPDIIESTGANFRVNTNLLEHTPINLLTEMTTALNGTVTIAYKKDAPTTDKPFAKWVLAGYSTNDNTAGDGEDITLTKFDYKRGRQDRSERQFLGYEQILEAHYLPNNNAAFTNADLTTDFCSKNIERAIDRRYANRSIYAQGSIMEERTGRISSDCAQVPIQQANVRMRNRYAQFGAQGSEFQTGRAFARTRFNVEAFLDREPSTAPAILRGRQHVFLAETLTEFAEPAEGSGDCPTRVATLQQFTRYDSNGNITEFKNYGRGVTSPDACVDNQTHFLTADLANDTDTSDNFTAKIRYLSTTGASQESANCIESAAYIRNRPISIEVLDSNTWLRKRSAAYQSTACLLSEMSVHYRDLDNSEKQATTTVTYDDQNTNGLPLFGNIVQLVSAKPDANYQMLPNGDHEGAAVSNIIYDSLVATYPVSISDGFKLQSNFAYDLRFGTPVCASDPNGRATFTELDGVGRSMRIWFPYYQTQLTPTFTVDLHALETMQQYPYTRYDNRFTLAEDMAYLGWHSNYNWPTINCHNKTAHPPISSTWWDPTNPAPLSPESYQSNLTSLTNLLKNVRAPRAEETLPVIATVYPDDKSSAALTRRLNLDLGGAPNQLTNPGTNQFDWIDTSVFIDGLGREIQTRSEARLTQKEQNGRPVKTIDSFTVSGRKNYDGLNRVVEIYYPIAARKPDENLSPSDLWIDIKNGREFPEATRNKYDHLDRVTSTRLPYCNPNAEGINIDLAKATTPIHPLGDNICDAETSGIELSKSYYVVNTSDSAELAPLVLAPTRHIKADALSTQELVTTYSAQATSAKTGYNVLASLDIDANGNQTRTLTDARGLTIEVQECHAFPEKDNFHAGGELPKPVRCEFKDARPSAQATLVDSEEIKLDSWIDTNLKDIHPASPPPKMANNSWKTRYAYDPVMQIVAVKKLRTDVNDENASDNVAFTLSTYDERGLRIQILNSDTGLVETRYDNAANVVEKITPNLRAQQITQNNDEIISIKHYYRQNRMEHINHPNNSAESDVLYCFADPIFIHSAYSKPGDTVDRTFASKSTPSNDWISNYPQLCKDTFATEYPHDSDDIAKRLDLAKRFHQMGRPVRVVLGDIATAEKTGKKNKLMRLEGRRYGPLGELTRQDRKLTHADGHDTQYVTLMRHDHLNRMREMAFPDGEVIKYNYDVGGQVRGIDWIRTHRRSLPTANADEEPDDIQADVFSYSGTYLTDQIYDEFGKTVGKKLGNGVCTYQLYGQSTRRLIAIESYRPIRFSKDSFIGIPVGVDEWNCNGQAHVQNLAYRYDNVGNITQITDLAAPRRLDRECGSSISCKTTLADPTGGWQQQRFFYDSLHRLVRAEGNLYPDAGPSLSLENDLNSDGDRTWNPPDASVEGSINIRAPGKHSYQLDMRYDELHRITRKTQTHHWQKYGQNKRKHATSYNWAYEYGQRSSSYSQSDNAHNPTHAPSKIGDTSLDYDYNGNLVAYSKSLTTDKHQHHIDRRLYWDDNNQLRLVTDSGSRKGHYLYDESGTRLIKRTADYENHYVNEYFVTSNRGNGRATKQIMAGGTRIAARVSNHRIGSVRADETPETYFYQSNHLGSTDVVTDDRAETYQHIAYFPTGEVWVEQPEESELIPYRFTGKELDRETGYQYFGARYYNPRLNIWISPDPILKEYLGTNPADLVNSGLFSTKNINLYAYAMQNPINLTDPDGKSAAKVAKLVYKLYKNYRKTGKINKKTLKKLGIDEAVDIAGDLHTIFDSSASAYDKVKAGVDLVSGLETNSKGNKVSKGVIDKLLKKKARKSKPGDIVATPKSHESGFIKKEKDVFYNPKTKEKWQKSDTQHSGSAEYKVFGRSDRIGNPSNKTTVIQNTGKVLKHDTK